MSFTKLFNIKFNNTIHELEVTCHGECTYRDLRDAAQAMFDINIFQMKVDECVVTHYNYKEFDDLHTVRPQIIFAISKWYYSGIGKGKFPTASSDSSD